MKKFFLIFALCVALPCLLANLINLPLLLINSVDYEIILILAYIFYIGLVITAITILKVKYNLVSFGKSLLAGLSAIGLIYMIRILQSLGNDMWDFQYMLEYQLMQFSIDFMILLYILLIAGVWYTFKKANLPGFAFLIPIYNIIAMLQIAKKPTWWLVLFLIPIVNIVFLIMTLNGISKNFGKSEGFTVGMVFLSIVFYCILGYGDATYIDNDELKSDSSNLNNNDVVLQQI